MTEKKEKLNNINIKSTKSQTQDIKDYKNEIILEEPQQFDCLIKKDKSQENQNENISNLNINNELQNKINYELPISKTTNKFLTFVLKEIKSCEQCKKDTEHILFIEKKYRKTSSKKNDNNYRIW